MIRFTFCNEEAFDRDLTFFEFSNQKELLDYIDKSGEDGNLRMAYCEEETKDRDLNLMEFENVEELKLFLGV